MAATEPVTFPAAAVPASTRRRYLAGAALLLAALVVVPATAAGTGTSLRLAALVLLVAAPVLWQAGMVPHRYAIDGETVTVHRRYLPDSRFAVAGEVREGQADPEPRRVAAGPVYREAPPEIRRMDRSRRVYKAMTDPQHAVRVPIRAGTLLVSPEDPQAFVRTAEALR